MTPERWQHLKQIVYDALELPPEERAGFLQEACAGDHALRVEIDSLLASYDQSVDLVDEPVFRAAVEVLDLTQPESLIGRALGYYQIIDKIGHGGMGDVYLARDNRLDRRVALKLLPDYFARQPERVHRFRREALAASALNHPNIVTIYEVGQQDSIHFIATEFIEGQTLSALISGRPLPITNVVDTAVQIADALDEAHSRGVIHRDIKSANIMVTSRGHIKLLDFGIAKVTLARGQSMSTDLSGEHLTASGAVLGTVQYMSPEQALGQKVDHRTDIFSLGVVMYEMATGCLPFERNSQVETMNAVINQAHTPVRKLTREVPLELSAVIDRALAKAPAERYQSTQEMTKDLRQIVTGDAAVNSADAPDGVSLSHLLPLRNRLSHEFRRVSSSRALVVSPVLLAALAVALWLWHPWTRKLPPQPGQRLVFVSAFSPPFIPRGASLSPEGNRIAFIMEADGGWQVGIKEVDRKDPIQITFGQNNLDRPRWSPTSDEILYVRNPAVYVRNYGERTYRTRVPAISDPRPSIWLVPSTGGTSRKVIENGRNPNWSWDGKRLVFERDYDIWIANADGSDQHKVEGVPLMDLALADRMPSFSPDGSLIAFVQKDSGMRADLWTVPSSGGQTRRLSFDVAVASAPVWTRDGRAIIFSRIPEGRPSGRPTRGGLEKTTLWKVPASGGQPEPVLLSGGEYFDPEISRDGTKLLCANTRNRCVLVLADPASGETRELKESRTNLFDPSFSPEGERILFFGLTEDGEQVFTINTDGSDFKQITHGQGENNVHPRWSADGSAIYHYQTWNTSFRKTLLPSGESWVLASGWKWETHNGARVNAEGKRIVYAKLNNGTIVATMIRDIETGTETVFPTLLSHPSWSRDGKFILGVDESLDKGPLADITICPVNGIRCRKVTRGDYPHWSYDNNQIYFLRNGIFEDGKEVWAVSPYGGDERHITDMRPLHPTGLSFDISAKGQLVWVRCDRDENELWLSNLPGS